MKYCRVDIESAVLSASQQEPLLSALRDSEFITDLTKDGQKINSLSGRCRDYSMVLLDKLTNAGIDAMLEYSHPRQYHTFLSARAECGRLIIDPTLGQTVSFNKVFVGTKEELWDVFTDPGRELLAGTRIWGTEKQITSRGDWFELLYGKNNLDVLNAISISSEF